MGNFFRKLHLWLGLSSGLLIVLISVSGAMYAFKEEIFEAIYHDNIYHDTNTVSETKPLDELLEIAQKELGPDQPINYFTTYNDPLRNWTFKAYKYNSEEVWYGKWLEYDQIVYVNPYTGKIISNFDHKWEFFHLVKMFHWSFLMSTQYGQPIVAFTVVVFLIALLTGLYMWWPFRKKRKGYRIETKKGKRIFNYDIHNVLGFYSIPVNVILSLTGMVWAFKWFMSFVYIVFSFSTTPPQKIDIQSKIVQNSFPADIFQTVYENSSAKHPSAYAINFYLPSKDSISTISTFVKNEKMVYYKAYQEKYDRFSGELLHSRGFEDLNGGEKIVGMNYDIHTGAVAGIFGKILAFIAAIIAASLPITGFIIWWRKRKSKSNQKNKLSELIN